MKTKILVLATGGTIVSSGASRTQMTGYSLQGLRVDDIVEAVPNLDNIADIEVHTVCNIPSSAINAPIWLNLARAIEDAAQREDIKGIVVTHGTDTMEETAFFLNLVLKTKKPVVLTGAMRPATALSADGPLNLFNAVAVAADPQAQEKGVLIVMNGIIGGARDTSKTNTTAVETFKGLDFGSMGYVIGGEVCFVTASLRPHTEKTEFFLSDFAKDDLPKVLLNTAYAGEDGLAIQAAMDAGYAGIVYAGCGHGTISVNVEPLLMEAVKRDMLVVRASRTPSGPVLNGLAHWQDAGFIPAGTLSPQKARILLQLVINKYGQDRASAVKAFKTY